MNFGRAKRKVTTKFVVTFPFDRSSIAGFRLNRFADQFHEVFERDADLLLVAEDPISDAPILFLFVADDEGEGDLLDLAVP